MHSYQKTFHELLFKRLAELARKREEQFAGGRWAKSLTDASMIGAKAMEHIGYLDALSDVEKICKDLLDELNRG